MEGLDRIAALLAEAQQSIERMKMDAGAASAPDTVDLDLSNGDWMEGSIAMRRWNASEDTLERWRNTNKVVAKKVVGKWYYSRKFPPITAQTSVEAYLKNANEL